MTAMKLQLVLCFLLGLYSLASATRQYQARFRQKSGGYVHAGRVDVYIDGHWGTICASDWDMNDAEVVCKELGKGYANTITVTGGTPRGTGTRCLSRVMCNGHESRLSDCEVTQSTRVSSSSDKGIVCYPPPSEAGLRLTHGPDQYSGRVEVKLASGSWSRLWYGYDRATRPKPASICRQLGFGELIRSSTYRYSNTQSVTYVYCAYGIADHRTCTFSSTSYGYQAFVGCHKPDDNECALGTDNCDTYAMCTNTAGSFTCACNAGYNGDGTTCTDDDECTLGTDSCDTNAVCSNTAGSFTCACNAGYNGDGTTCTDEDECTLGTDTCDTNAVCTNTAGGFTCACNAGYNGDGTTCTDDDECTLGTDNCDTNAMCTNTAGSFACACNTRYNGDGTTCTADVAAAAYLHDFCSAPAVPPDSTVQNLRLTYKMGDEINVTCNHGPGWFLLECEDGIWSGQNVVCPDPVIECNPPIIPAVSSIGDLKPRYKIGDVVNVACNDGSDSFIWECQVDGQWRGSAVRCAVSQPLTTGAAVGRFGNGQPFNKQDERDFLSTGLLVAAVIMFILVFMSIVAFSVYLKSRSSGPSKDTIQDDKTDRGPLPDVPDGYAKYIVDDSSLYVEPYQKLNDQPLEYETFEKPV